MFSYAKLAVLALQVVRFFLEKQRDDRQFAAGEEHAVVEHAKAVLGMTAEGRRILEKIDAMDDRALDDLTDAVGRAGR